MILVLSLALGLGPAAMGAGRRGVLGDWGNRGERFLRSLRPSAEVVLDLAGMMSVVPGPLEVSHG
jgi:hypothetical protein